MIEDEMLFALGFLVALLLALACLPAVSKRALRLSRRRLEMLVPLSMAEIVAERDGIRAAAAVEQRRLEQRNDATRQTSADLASELGRRTVSLVQTEGVRDKALADRAALIQELAATSRSLTDVEGQCAALEVAMHGVFSRLETEQDNRAALLQEYEHLQNVAHERRATIAALETRVGGLQAQLQDNERDRDLLTTEQSRLRATLAELTRERDAVRNELLLATTQRTMLQGELKQEMSRASDRHARLAAKSEALAIAERKIMEQTAELNATAAALSNLKQRFEALQNRLIDQGTEKRDAPLSESELKDLRHDIAEVADDALHLLRENAGEGTRAHSASDADRLVLAEPPGVEALL